mmetsp:Transcript_29129/g.70337  ORF Transcript_29129/g.70337 Transcript_29129/m.70337 type:complete len:290 (+) Transcript_29129:83-952(+)|eukprot:CAMPEP_0113643472 /NCGR_PEP_ID=MMETSP0017_2-20120614/22860_1 /TAXON_ID=2856 /ORGANISM="Cylindrotheca closterium" /LENGTH=289 /DNA_ID=CAMNT_0000554993 /DNA_START=32 /DNA_END=901 /DNA_ORIENTATION=+ /assembly_acc=CAM_ASM_000147
MGLFKRKSSAPTLAEEEDVVVVIVEEAVETFWDDESSRSQVLVLCVMIAAILLLRVASSRHLKMLSGEHTLRMTHLNDAVLFQEVFLAYLNAALLEPILAIGGMEEVKGAEFASNALSAAAICWWIWLLTDAFDFADVIQFFTYHGDFREQAESDPKKYSFLKFSKKEDDALSERKSLVGTLKKDVALWFMLVCIAAAWLPGIGVTHRDAIHAYVIVFLWSIMHHVARQATAWSAGYFFTFLFPSTALMPLEYCLPLMDVADVVEDVDFLVTYRAFVHDRTGVDLIIES